MIFIDYNDETIALLLAVPNWETAIKVDLQLPVEITKGLSALESRRAFATSARFTITYKATLAGAAQSTALRLWLMRLRDETVAVPMWTDSIELANAVNAGGAALVKTSIDPARYGAEWLITADDMSIYEIVTVDSIVGNNITLHAGVQNNWPAGTQMWPLMFGHLMERPKPESITDELTDCELKIKESSPYSRRLNPLSGNIPVVGANVPNFSALPLLDVEPSWEQVIDFTEDDLQWENIGFTREDEVQDFGNPNRRGLELTFFQGDRGSIAKIERLFVDRRASVRPFMVPTSRGDLRITQDLPIAGNTSLITIEGSEYTDPDRPTNPGDPYFALIGPGTIEPVKIATVDITGLHTTVPISQSHSLSDTKLSHLQLSRFADPQISWSYDSDGIATAKIKCLELANEYVTLQANLPEPVLLYRFTLQLDTPQYYRFTSYENSFTTGGETFLPGPFSHGSIKTDATLQSEQLDLTSFKFSGNPLANFIPYSFEAILWLDVLEADASDPGNPPGLIWTGKVSELDAQGDDWKAICKVFGGIFERNFPNFYVQRVCNYAIYTPVPKCGVNKDTFRVTGNISSIAGTEVHVLAGNAKPADYFSIGFIETGAAAAFERRSIMHSEPITGGTKLLLAAPLANAIVGQSLNMFPGCNGTVQNCVTPFNNLLRFGGHAYVPDTNPTIKAMEPVTPSGGKK